MKKITAVIGSPRKEKSNTGKLLKNFLTLVKEEYHEVDYEIIYLEDALSYCKGCMACTKVGDCIINDSLNEIKVKLLHSDLIILGSPVYVNGVSGQFKVFADRIFVWLHTLKLIGKPSISVITTDFAGIGPTRKFIKLVQYTLGTIPLGSLEASIYFSKDFDTMEFCRKKYGRLAKDTANILKGEKTLRPKLYNQFLYQNMKSKAKYGKENLPYEYKLWTESGWMKMSFKQAMKSMVK